MRKYRRKRRRWNRRRISCFLHPERALLPDWVSRFFTPIVTDDLRRRWDHMATTPVPLPRSHRVIYSTGCARNTRRRLVNTQVHPPARRRIYRYFSAPRYFAASAPTSLFRRSCINARSWALNLSVLAARENLEFVLSIFEKGRQG